MAAEVLKFPHYLSKNFPDQGPDVQISGQVRGVGLFALAASRVKSQLVFEYAGSALGGIWHLIQPLSMIAIYAVVFGIFMRVQPEYPEISYGLYLCSVLVPWMAFSESITKGSNSIVRNRQYLRKLNVSEVIFSVESFIQVLISLSLGYVGVIILGLVEGVSIQWSWLALPPVLMLMIACGSGIGLFFAVLVPFFTDLTHAIQICVRPMFWLTPVLYPITMVDDGFLLQVVSAQPSTPFVLAIRKIYFEGVFPSASSWLAMCVWPICTVTAGVVLLRCLRHEIRDVL